MFSCDLKDIFRRCVAGVLVLAIAWPSAPVRAQSVVLSPAGQRVGLSQAFQPVMLSAVTVDPNNPFQFDFYMDDGQLIAPKDTRQDEYLLLIKDFLAALTTPEEQLWVNLSPYEKDRIIDDRFGQTDMGRDLLAQDYMLKQITASLLYPEDATGRKFWDEIYRRAYEQYGTTDIPVDTFNKVWIMPDTAEVYQQGTSALVLKGTLKVMLESDYLSAQKNAAPPGTDPSPVAPDERQRLAKEVMREVVVPVLVKEVNEGKNFARLRQIYNALILAAWYKKSMRESFLGKFYVDRSKVNGIQQPDVADNQKIYSQYIEAFRKGVFNFIQEDVDRYTGETIPRKYLSGGFTEVGFSKRLVVKEGGIGGDFAQRSNDKDKVRVSMERRTSSDGKRLTSMPVRKLGPAFSKRGLDEIRALADYVLEHQDRQIFGRDKKLFDTKYAALKVIIKDQFKKFVEKEAQRVEDKELKMAVVDVFNSFVDAPEDDPTGLKRLILSGEYTQTVFDHFLGVILMADGTNPQTLYEVLDVFDLNDEVRSKLMNILPKFNTLSDYENFHKGIVSLAVLDKNNDARFFGTKNFSDMSPVLKNLREASEIGDFKYQPGVSVEVQAKNWVEKMTGTSKVPGLARYYFDAAKKLLEDVQYSFISREKRDQALVFLRTKEKKSLLDKLLRKDKPKAPSQISDILAGRFALRNYEDISNMLEKINKYSIHLSDYMDSMNVKIQRKLALRSTYDEGSKKQVAIDKEINELRKQQNSFIDDQGRFILAELTRDNGNTPWYAGVVYHANFMLGNQWQVEAQIKTLPQAIVHDLEHKLGYKVKEINNDDVRLRFYDHVIRYIWVMNISEALEYLGLHVPKRNLVGFLTAIERKVANGTEDVTKDPAARTDYGGIDVRNVEDNLRANPGAGIPQFNYNKAGVVADDLTGFTPRIMSIEAVAGFSFLQGAASSGAPK